MTGKLSPKQPRSPAAVNVRFENALCASRRLAISLIGPGAVVAGCALERWFAGSSIMMESLGAKGSADLVHFAIRHGLAEP